MIQLKIDVNQSVFTPGNYVYVWFLTAPETAPFYVGETSQSVADRVGLHIRHAVGKSRSGSTVGKYFQEEDLENQTLIVTAYEIDKELLTEVALENGSSSSKASINRARKAIEFSLYAKLLEHYDSMYKIRGSSWKAKSANTFIEGILADCLNASGNKSK